MFHTFLMDIDKQWRGDKSDMMNVSRVRPNHQACKHGPTHTHKHNHVIQRPEQKHHLQQLAVYLKDLITLPQSANYSGLATVKPSITSVCGADWKEQCNAYACAHACARRVLCIIFINVRTCAQSTLHYILHGQLQSQKSKSALLSSLCMYN